MSTKLLDYMQLCAAEEEEADGGGGIDSKNHWKKKHTLRRELNGNWMLLLL